MYAKMLASFQFEETVGNSLVVREPVGVVACITPWNYPLHQIAAKIGPALAAGCTVVLKPSEVAPLNAFILAEVVEAAGLPAGVFNLVTGYGPVVGEALAAAPEVDMVSFTGSTRAGKRVAELASQTVKKVALELGGKSASVVLDDADFAAAVKGTVSACYINSGQTCSAHTRMLVPASRYEEAAKLAVEVAATYTVGDPMAETTRLGPLISAAQRERVQGYIRKGVADGAELLTGGADAPDGLSTGYFVKPTVFGRVDPASSIAQEEIFGAGAVHHHLSRRRRCDKDRQRHALRPGWRRLVQGRRTRQAGGPPPAHRTGRHQRRAVQSDGAIRRLQTIRHRP